MKMQDVMVRDALNQVEKSPAEKHRPDKQVPRPKDIAHEGRAEQQKHTDGRHHPSEGMKNPVPKHIDLHVAAGVFRQTRRQHGVNLKNLVEKDAVQKSTQAHTETDAGSGEGFGHDSGFHNSVGQRAMNGVNGDAEHQKGCSDLQEGDHKRTVENA